MSGKKENPLPKEELLAFLLELGRSTDFEKAHGDADEALLKYINDPEISSAYHGIHKWYA